HSKGPASRLSFGLLCNTAFLQSQRDCVLQPRVARNEQPWVAADRFLNPNGVVPCVQRCAATPLYLFSARWGLDRSADFQSAVSPNCIRQSVGSVPRAAVSKRMAECNSAIQQS